MTYEVDIVVEKTAAVTRTFQVHSVETLSRTQLKGLIDAECQRLRELDFADLEDNYAVEARVEAHSPGEIREVATAEMKVADLRSALEPYGTMHRDNMNKAQLVQAVERIQGNLRRFGSAERPHGFFEDEHPTGKNS
jgi:hypothetical protein